MSANPIAVAANDPDAVETQEWLDALDTVIEREGPERAHYLLERLIEQARRSGTFIPLSAATAYINTIPPHLEERSPGDPALEERIRSYVRWNAMAMVVRANRGEGDLGGHIDSYASVGTLMEVGFNYFWHAPDAEHGGDLIYIQGHSSPGVYARAFLEGRISEEQLLNFRREVDGKGVSSYPHPKLMPDFWQFPTVSMGLGPIQAIYQARFLKYLPARGNGKIIQELEGEFRGGGWNVIKVIWGSYWDPLLARDSDGLLRRLMEETVDGEYQNYKANDGAYVRKHFFGKYPQLLERVSRMTDEDIWRLNRGGHDPHKIYAAYAAATRHSGQPTVILAKTVKGYGMGKIGEAKNPTHQLKKLDTEAVREFRDRFRIPIPDDRLAELPLYRPDQNSPEIKYLHERRRALGGYLPQRRRMASEAMKAPPLETFSAILEPTAEGREISTTQAFVRFLTQLVRDKTLGPRVVPIIPDEARTFGMEGMFRQLGIFSQQGQLYEPVDRDQVMYYREDKAGQILEEGINEAGAMSSWIAAATSYSSNDRIMLPFYIFYSMFGFQRVGDLAWAAGDMQARGFLLGGTSGRTTLNGEGLQHQDGHSHVLASVVPNCVCYDPTFAHEVAVILRDGVRRMVEEQENVWYYVTLLNENYPQPGLLRGQEAGILKGMYRLREGPAGSGRGQSISRVQLLGSGSILRQVIAAAELLEADWGVAGDVWSVTSFTELRRDGLEVERWNLLHPASRARKAFATEALERTAGPIVASTDYMRLFADQIRPQIPQGRTYKVLGTDGFGRSDTRAKLRSFFEVDRHYVAVAALKALAEEGSVAAWRVAEAIQRYGIDPERPSPWVV